MPSDVRPTQGMDESACPKRMTYGPCGGVRPDGQCEMRPGACSFVDYVPWAGPDVIAAPVLAPLILIDFSCRPFDPADLAAKRDLVSRSGLTVEARRPTEGLPAASEDWQRRIDAVTDALTARHSGTRAWELAEQQGERIGRLLADHAVTGELLILRR